MKVDQAKKLIDKAHSVNQVVRLAMQAEFLLPYGVNRVNNRYRIADYAASRIKELG